VEMNAAVTEGQDEVDVARAFLREARLMRSVSDGGQPRKPPGSHPACGREPGAQPVCAAATATCP
jgi:hypothetical protein